MTTVTIDHLEVDYWPIMPPEQTPERVRDRIPEFGRAHTGPPAAARREGR